jgi:hypothetical protein
MVKIPKKYEWLLKKCEQCGSLGRLKKVKAAGRVNYLCDSCIAVLKDMCNEKSGGITCEGCGNTHDDYTQVKKIVGHDRDDGQEIVVEYQRCIYCKHLNEIESYDPDSDPHFDEWYENLKKIEEFKKALDEVT